MTRSPAPTTNSSRRSASSRGRRGATRCASSSPRARTCSAAADAAGWPPSSCCCRGGHRACRATEVAPRAAARRLPARLGHARARRLRAALGAGAGRAAVRRAVGRQRPRQRRHGAALGARLRRRAASRSAPARADPVRAQGGARVDGRDLRACRSRASRRSPSCPGARSRWSRARGRPLAELERASVTLVVGAEREGLPAEVVAACDAGRPHPDRRRSRSTPRWRRRSRLYEVAA